MVYNRLVFYSEKILLLTGLDNLPWVKCSDSGAEKVEILSDSIQELT